MLVELHMIQNFAPSNLNRDDTNSPKDCEFGGYRRARISSQCMKRAVRTRFREGEMLPEEHLAQRTKRVVEALKGELTRAGKDESQALAVAKLAINSLATKTVEDDKTQYLLFLGKREISALATTCLDHWTDLSGVALQEVAAAGETGGKRSTKEEKRAAKQAVPSSVREAFLRCLDGGKACDLALFGRMIADLPEKNIDAACQVAHAISTHKVSTEFDFYTAVDDLKAADVTGADMMGTVEFNSACFYRYANVDVDQLRRNLGGDVDLARQTVEAFLRAAVEAIPSGKQNSMAAHNPPSLIYTVVRDRAQPWSLANAFVRPVRPDAGGDLVQKSIEEPAGYWSRLERAYGTNGIRTRSAVSVEDGELGPLQGVRVKDLHDLIKTTLDAAFPA